MKKALYICQALTAVLLFTQWDPQRQAQYISCSCVCLLIQRALQPGLGMVWALSVLQPEENNVQKDFPRGAHVKFLVGMDSIVTMVKKCLCLQASLNKDQWFKTWESIISYALTRAYPRAIFSVQMNTFQLCRCCTDILMEMNLS